VNNRTVFHSGGSKPNCAAPIFNQRDSARTISTVRSAIPSPCGSETGWAAAVDRCGGCATRRTLAV